jgi:hypothetical protein
MYNASKIKVEIKDGPVHHLKISADQLTVIVAIAGGNVLLYDAKALAAGVGFIFSYMFSCNIAPSSISMLGLLY